MFDFDRRVPKGPSRTKNTTATENIGISTPWRFGYAPHVDYAMNPSLRGEMPVKAQGKCLEAQQRYFSYRAILVAIVSQNSFVFVFMGYRTIITRYVAKWGVAQMCLCETKYQGGVSHHFGGVLTFPKTVSRDMGYRSDSIAVSRDMGPPRENAFHTEVVRIANHNA